jgi:hypothetical protein
MLRFLNTYLPLILLIGIVYVFRAPLWVVSHQAIREVAPCRIPITYEIDSAGNILSHNRQAASVS